MCKIISEAYDGLPVTRNGGEVVDIRAGEAVFVREGSAREGVLGAEGGEEGGESALECALVSAESEGVCAEGREGRRRAWRRGRRRDRVHHVHVHGFVELTTCSDAAYMRVMST